MQQCFLPTHLYAACKYLHVADITTDIHATGRFCVQDLERVHGILNIVFMLFPAYTYIYIIYIYYIYIIYMGWAVLSHASLCMLVVM